jgi:serine/threonine protein kinase
MQGTASAGADSAKSPTLTISPTRGAAVDQRADIWAFGLVLYEMLASRPTFAGDTVTDILASVMKE